MVILAKPWEPKDEDRREALLVHGDLRGGIKESPAAIIQGNGSLFLAKTGGMECFIHPCGHLSG